MSNKPLKFSEIKKQRQKSIDAQRKNIPNFTFPPYTMIVTEGKRTEPYYLEALVESINSYYRPYTKHNYIEIDGTGRNTTGLLKYVTDRIENEDWSKFHTIWLVYDKDDFPLDRFDNTQYKAESYNKEKEGATQLRVAWSNESVELWFLLHFQDYHADNGRERYIEKLKTYFDYEKNLKDIYRIINQIGSEQKAIQRAKALEKAHNELGNTCPTRMVPMTKMYLLVEEMNKYKH